MMPYIGLLPLLWRVTRAHVRSAITKPGQSYLLQVGFAHATSAEYILPPPPGKLGEGSFRSGVLVWGLSTEPCGVSPPDYWHGSVDPRSTWLLDTYNHWAEAASFTGS
ncbi:hypothetical protein BHE74_00052986 [Ensete ventricosum]|nr:hypothetical protein BHE74_00052986 [Ensete ventricosum]